MINEKDLNKIVLKSLADAGGLLFEDKTQQNETYVAQPKPYATATELLSDKAKQAHLAMYQSHVTKINEISIKIDSASRETSEDGSDYRSLKQDEVHNLNAVYLHELYFANCYDPHSEIFMDSLAYMRLERDFGTFAAWQTDFMSCCMSSRDGFAICGYNVFLRKFVNTFVDDYSDVLMLATLPVIVIDVAEHAYFHDYLQDRKSYIVAMMRELNWNVIEERFKKMDKVGEALK